jgi:uncharacterized protein (TIGR02646 family)
MIQIKKPKTGPKNLIAKGVAQTAKDCSAYDACPSDYKSGKKFEKRSYYNARPVKTALMKAHNNKCCYCETKSSSPGDFDVEHYRPKNGVKQSRKQKHDDCPGYYWLTYDWDNLLLSCHDCNRDCKSTFFPLSNPRQRARCHHDDIKAERPLIINPTSKGDPRRHIKFHHVSPVGLTRKGRVTIELLGLRRSSLREKRLLIIELINSQLTIIESAKRHPRDRLLQRDAIHAQQIIDSAVLSDAAFSSMVKDYLNGFTI